VASCDTEEVEDNDPVNDYVAPRAWVDQDQDWFDLAVERLRRDLLATTDLRPRLEVDLSNPVNPDLAYRYSRDPDHEGIGHGAWLRPPESAADAVVVVADVLVDDVIEELWIAWPVCPGHGHPAEVRVVGRDAVWTCPKSGATIALVGELPAP
jgi:hypothetical protein